MPLATAGTRFTPCDSAFGPVLLAAALLVSGCDSGGDDPTTTQAAKDVSAWMDELETRLTDGIEPLRAWQTTDDGSKDHRSGCDDGKARRTYVAVLDVPAAVTTLDADNREALLMGQLLDAAWEPSGIERRQRRLWNRIGVPDQGRRRPARKLTISFSPVERRVALRRHRAHGLPADRLATSRAYRRARRGVADCDLVSAEASQITGGPRASINLRRLGFG